MLDDGVHKGVGAQTCGPCSGARVRQGAGGCSQQLGIRQSIVIKFHQNPSSGILDERMEAG